MSEHYDRDSEIPPELWWAASIKEAGHRLNGFDPTEPLPQRDVRELFKSALLVACGLVTLDPAFEERWGSTMGKMKTNARCYYLGHDHARGRELAAWRLIADFFKPSGQVGERLLHTIRVLLGGVLILDQRSYIDVFEERQALDLWVLIVNGIQNLAAIDRYPVLDDPEEDIKLHYVVPDVEFFEAVQGKELLVMYARPDDPSFSVN